MKAYQEEFHLFPLIYSVCSGPTVHNMSKYAIVPWKTITNRFFDFPCCILFGAVHYKLVANVRGTYARLCKAAFIHGWKRPTLSFPCPIFFGPLQAWRTRDTQWSLTRHRKLNCLSIPRINNFRVHWVVPPKKILNICI